MTERKLPDGWRWVRFGDVVRQVKVTTRNPAADGLTRVVGLEHLDSESLPLRRWNELADLGDGTSFTRVFQSGQVLFGKRRAYQRKVAVPEFDGICSGDILVFEPSTDDLVPEFLPYLVQSDGFFDHALDTSAGSLSPRTKFQELAKYEFALPPVPEQRRIVGILGTLAAAGDGYAKAEQRLRNLRNAVAEEEFERVPAERYVELACVMTIPPQNGLTVPKDQRLGEVAMINMGAIFGDQLVIDASSSDSVSIAPEQLARFQLAEGDLLFARRSIVLAGAGRSVLIGSARAPAVFESSIIRVRPDPSVVLPEYLLGFLHSPSGIASMRRIARKGAVAGIAGSDLKRLPVPVPTLESQGRTTERLSLVDASDLALREHRAQCAVLGAGLRENLLRGVKS